MGLSDKLVSQPTPDLSERLARLLGPGETPLAHCRVGREAAPAAFGTGAIAASFTRAADPLVLSVSDVYLTFWDLGATGDEQPALACQLPREYVASFELTGEHAPGVPVARMAFTDGSAVDWRLIDRTGREFFAAAGL